jgi:hypothetical protein
MKQEILADVGGTFKVYVYQDNLIAVPSAATMDVYKPGQTTKFLDGVTVTVNADGMLSYALSADNNDIPDENYKVVVTFTLDGTDYDRVFFYDVVLSKLEMVITDDDLIRELPLLAKNGRSYAGTSTAGSTTTMTDLALQQFIDNYWTGGMAYSATQDDEREITDFDQATGVVTFNAFASDAGTDDYILRRSFLREIENAFDKIKKKIRDKGKRPFLVLDAADLYEPHVLLAVAEICKGLATDRDSIFWDLWKDYQEQFENSFGSLTFKYDFSQDGFISGAEESESMGGVKLIRG